MTRALAPIMLFSVAAAAPCVAQPAADEAAVRTVVSGFHAALSSGSAGSVMALVAADAVFLEAGTVETRAQYEKDHLPADIEFEKGVSITRSPIRIVVVGDAAWATCTSEYQGTFQGRAVDSLGTELMVLSRGAEGWRIRAIHWSSRPRPKPKP
jgi:ketosteroid isomerase-like protein